LSPAFREIINYTNYEERMGREEERKEEEEE